MNATALGGLGAAVTALARVLAAALLAAPLLVVLAGAAAAQGAEETWQSDWAPVTFTVPALTGHWQQSTTARGQIKGGSYDRATRALRFDYWQDWNQMTGVAALRLAEDGKTLSGTWSQKDPQGRDGSSGTWTMTRAAPSALLGLALPLSRASGSGLALLFAHQMPRRVPHVKGIRRPKRGHQLSAFIQSVNVGALRAHLFRRNAQVQIRSNHGHAKRRTQEPLRALTSDAHLFLEEPPAVGVATIYPLHGVQVRTPAAPLLCRRIYGMPKRKSSGAKSLSMSHLLYGGKKDRALVAQVTRLTGAGQALPGLAPA